MRIRIEYGTLLVLAIFLAGSLLLGASIEGEWAGTLVYMEVDRDIAITFTADGDALSAKIDAPEGGLWGASLEKVKFTNPEVHFELPFGGGVVIFDGTLEGDNISGGYNFDGYQEKFQLSRKKN
jgi:hypothetical protein